MRGTKLPDVRLAMEEWVPSMKTKHSSPLGVHRAVVLILFAFAVLPGLAVAHANDAYGQSLDQAVVEFNAGNYEEAHALFRHAHSLNPSARTWRGLGICAFELRMYIEAMADLEAALAAPRKPLTPAQRAETTSLLEKPADLSQVITSLSHLVMRTWKWTANR